MNVPLYELEALRGGSQGLEDLFSAAPTRVSSPCLREGHAAQVRISSLSDVLFKYSASQHLWNDHVRVLLLLFWDLTASIMRIRHSSANSVTFPPTLWHQIKDRPFQLSLASSSTLIMESLWSTRATSIEALHLKMLQLLFLLTM